MNFLLYGESTFLNKGCEAIVNTTIKKIQKIGKGEIVLSTNDLAYDSQYYKDIITKYVKGYYQENELTEEEKEKIKYYQTIPFDYTNFEKIYEKDCLKEIENADICMSVGGDNYCYGEPNWIYTINKEIKAKNKKNIFWCTSLFEEIESAEMIRDLKTFDIIVARETLTYKALEKFVDKERLMLSPDTAFSLGKKKVDLPEVFKKGKKVVGINISPLISKYTEKENNILASIKALIDFILKETDNNICLIPHVYIEGNNDLDSLKMVKKLYKEEERIGILDEKIYDCEELKYVISNCSYLIAARTHASIAGYSSLVPTLVIGYSVKSKGIALDLFGEHENYVIPVDKMTPESLLDKFQFMVVNEKQIKNILEEKIPDYKEKADNQLIEVLRRLEALDKKYVTSKFKCTGCEACKNICPHGAIQMIESEEGFLYPHIDKEKCTECNLCRKICPANKVYKNEYEAPEFYAVKNLEETDRKNSSSGGVVCAIAKDILKENGVVYGVALEDKEAKHIRISKIEDLYKIMGSKYVQSKIDDILKEVKKDLEEKKKVLFTGTPCQIEGLQSYLGKTYENLICLSIICHGVPSPKVWKRYVEGKSDTLENVNFRNKDFGWHKYSVLYQYQDGEKEIVPFIEDIYMQGFLKNYFLRESCYNCQMRFNKKNSADIIIGDFWGIENVFPKMDDDKGISAVIINSAKGKEIFQKIKEKMEYQETTFEDILEANPCLIGSVEYTKSREKFFELARDNTIEIVINVLKGMNAEKEIEEKNQEISILNKQIKDLLEAKQFFLGQIEQKDLQIEQKDTQMKEKDIQIQEKINEIQKIYNSRRWKYSSKIAKIITGIKRKKWLIFYIIMI